MSSTCGNQSIYDMISTKGASDFKVLDEGG